MAKKKLEKTKRPAVNLNNFKPKYPELQCLWLDHENIDDDPWLTPDEIKVDSDCVVKTLGFYARHNDRYIWAFGDCGPAESEDASGSRLCRILRAGILDLRIKDRKLQRELWGKRKR